MGVSAFFFLPIFVAAFTSADEFHSVTNTRCPSAVSHLASRASCVDFPEPSMPSTTNSLPGYSCGCVRLFSIGGRADLHSERLSGEPLERRGVTHGGPHLQLGVARRANLQQIVVASVVELDGADRLRVASIEALGETQDCRERPDRSSYPASERTELVVAPLGRALTVIARDERDRFDFLGLEPAQVAVLDQIVRVLVVPFVADMDAQVVQDGGVLDPLAFEIRHAV